MRLGPLSLRADARGLRTLEMLLVSHQAGAIRWIPPMLFQALGDFIGLLGQTLFDRGIAWARCDARDARIPPFDAVPIDLTGWWID